MSRKRRLPDGGYGAPVSCRSCGAADARDAAHARGCPKLQPVSREKLLRIARAAEAEWDRKRARNAAWKALGAGASGEVARDASA